MSWLDDIFDSGSDSYDSSSSSSSMDDLINSIESSGSDAPLGGYDLSIPGNYEQLIEQLGNNTDYSAPLGGIDVNSPGGYAQLMARLALNPESGSDTSSTVSSLLDMLSKFTKGTGGTKSPLASLLGLGSIVGQVGSALTAKGSPALSAPAMTQANPHATPMTWKKMRTGGSTGGCGCQGALGLLKGGSPGQMDNVPISASHGEYVMDADSVSALGDGNTDAGAAKLDQMRENLRRHKRSAPPTKIPPKAKSPEQYLKGAK